MRIWLAMLAMLLAMSSPAAAQNPAPYPEAHQNFIYNLLFCDDPALFRTAKEGADTPRGVILSDHPDPKRVEAIANDASQESRTRALAYNWLRLNGHMVPKHILLGVIMEVPQDEGLDTLAAFADGSVRYINQSGRMAVVEGELAALKPTLTALFAASQTVVDKIGPWDKPRLPAPPKGHLRMTFVVSDGLYFGEGPMKDLISDPMAGPVFERATQLLLLVTRLDQKPN